jgi:hypothetical protein
MSPAILIVAVPVLAAILWKAFAGRSWKKKAGTDNNWTNEGYAARQESGSWSESELAVTKGTAGPRRTGGGSGTQ